MRFPVQSVTCILMEIIALDMTQNLHKLHIRFQKHSSHGF